MFMRYPQMDRASLPSSHSTSLKDLNSERWDITVLNIYTINPDHANCIAPHKRTLHTIIPGMIAQNGVPLVTFGVMGGQMQAQGHLQFVCNLVDFNMDVQNALDAPRFRVMDDSRIMLETGIPMNTQASLAQKGHHIILGHTFFGGGQAIFINPSSGTLVAGSDPRRDGCAVGY